MLIFRSFGQLKHTCTNDKSNILRTDGTTLNIEYLPFYKKKLMQKTKVFNLELKGK